MKNKKNDIIKKLEKLEMSNSLEVEHILALVHKADKLIIPQLKELSEKNNWSEINDELIIPFATWVEIICEYLSEGIHKIISLAMEKNNYSHFAIAVLEELKTIESVNGLSRVLSSCNLSVEKDYKIAIKILSSINLKLSFNNSIHLPLHEKEQLRKLIELKLMQIEASEFKTVSDVVICLCALRGVGNEETIAMIKKRTPMEDTIYKGLEKKIIKFIKKNDTTHAKPN